MNTRAEDDLIKPSRKHLQTLQRRIANLTHRVGNDAPSSRNFDRAEIEALTVSANLMDLHFAEQSIGEEVLTSALLHEAAELAHAHGQHTTAERFRRRAKLLEEQ
jgi:hypothetical protein